MTPNNENGIDNNEHKINGLIEPESSFCPEWCFSRKFSELVQCLFTVPLHISPCSTVACIVSYWDLYCHSPLCSKHTNLHRRACPSPKRARPHRHHRQIRSGWLGLGFKLAAAAAASSWRRRRRTSATRSALPLPSLPEAHGRLL